MDQLESQDNPDAPLYVGSMEKWDFGKGVVDVHGKVVLPCDTRFLIELVTKLDRRYDSIFRVLVSYSDQKVPERAADKKEGILGSKNPKQSPTGCAIISDELCQTVNDVALFFVEIAREVRRLQRYQSLFPDESILQTFQSAMLFKISMNHTKWTSIVGDSSPHVCWTRLQKSEYLIELWLNHPTYQYDLKSWNQFLNDESPGSGINAKSKFLKQVYGDGLLEPPETVLQGNFHIIPIGGWVLWRTWVERYHEIEQRIHRTVIPAHLRSNSVETPNPKFNKELNNLEPMLYSYQTVAFNFRPNLWSPRGDREIVFPEDTLPALEALIGDLEGFIVPEFEDPLTRGLLVSGYSNSIPILGHCGDIFI